MIYVRGTSTWHAVRTRWDWQVDTVCGRAIQVGFGDPRIAAGPPDSIFLCRSCRAIIERSGEAA